MLLKQFFVYFPKVMRKCLKCTLVTAVNREAGIRI